MSVQFIRSKGDCLTPPDFAPREKTLFTPAAKINSSERFFNSAVLFAPQIYIHFYHLITILRELLLEHFTS